MEPITFNPIYETIGIISGVLGLSIAIPQLWRIMRTKTYQGVSISTWLITLASFTLWFAYAVRFNSPSQAIANGIALTLTTILTHMLLKQHLKILPTILTMIVLVTACYLIGYYTNETIMTIILLTIVITSRIPQIIASRNNYITQTPTAVSKMTYTLTILSSVGWITYGILTGLWQNIASSAIAIITSIIVILYEKRKLES